MPRLRLRHAVRAALAALVPLALLGASTGPAHSAPGAAWPEPVPVVSHIETTDPVVFITIDDGWYHDPAAAKLLLDRRVPASLFLLPGAYSYDSGYFHTLLNQGSSRVENHTVNHPDLTALDAAGQKAEICGARDQHLARFGDGPRLLRPPYGTYDATTRTAARACGAKAVVTWTYDLTTWGSWTPPAPQLKAGDIILLHFNETVTQDLKRALDLAEAAGLKPAPLREYVPE
ncbi:polysaccharide deacetylase family protein [Streptomyces gardneri]|uniref:polysaccharide deacetylase family protein n=1 Tax=Streptomyces gardneri TaxID=66892 RepID=UPI0006BCBB34|nr:polysaccharide deacetylase family protein [Streptomyces gardneri]QPK47539.1 polysaccharide deacetylase family protein [Streptomyces gardneri]WRK38977.1 polysaccharide deacetylase family protein [Streptomyces venezuelae]CUM38983.1 secreted protein [Streptomyces venezuelae]